MFPVPTFRHLPNDCRENLTETVHQHGEVALGKVREALSSSPLGHQAIEAPRFTTWGIHRSRELGVRRDGNQSGVVAVGVEDGRPPGIRPADRSRLDATGAWYSRMEVPRSVGVRPARSERSEFGNCHQRPGRLGVGDRVGGGICGERFLNSAPCVRRDGARWSSEFVPPVLGAERGNMDLAGRSSRSEVDALGEPVLVDQLDPVHARAVRY